MTRIFSRFHDAWPSSSALLLGIVIVATLPAQFGCSDSSSTSYKASELVIDTLLSTDFAAPGEAVGVTCSITHFEDGKVDLDTVIVVTPSIGVRIDGNTVVGETIGIYEVACALKDEPAVVDQTPARLGITPKGVASVDTLVAPTPIAAGDVATVTCIAKSVSGQSVEVPMDFDLSPADAGVIEGMAIEGRKVGTHTVACRLRDFGEMSDTSPATLTVVPGDIVRTEATLDAASYTAGELTTLQCRAFDQWDNPVASADMHARVEPTTGVKVNDYSLTMQTVGSYEAFCDLDKDQPVEQTGASFVVVGAGAAGLSILVEPDQPAYAPADEVKITWTVVDVFGNDLGAAQGVLTAPSSGVTDLGGGKFRLDAEGIHTFRVDTTTEPPLSAERPLIVDARGPTLVITKPPRGSTFDGDGIVKVEGYVHDDTTSIGQLTVGGKVLTVAPDGTFATTVDSVAALNLLTAKATDGAGNLSETSVAWYYSTGWQPYENTTIDDVIQPGALELFMGQAVIDDGVHDFNDINDFATLIELVLTQADITELAGALLPPLVLEDIISLPLFSVPVPFTSDDIDFYLTGDLIVTLGIDEFQVGDTEIKLDSRNGGIDLEGSFQPAPGFSGIAMGISLTLELPITLTANVPNIGPIQATINPSAYSITYATADSFSFFTSYDISKASGQPLQVTGNALQLQLDGLTIAPFQNALLDLGTVKILGQTVDLPEIPLDQVIGPIGDLIGDLVGPLTEFLIDVVSPILEPLLAGVAAEVLKAVLESVEIADTLPIPGLLGGDGGELQLSVGLDTVSFTEAGGFLGLDGGVWAEKAVEPSPLGLMLRDQCLGQEPGSFSFSAQHPMGIALKFDFLNALFHGLWWNGLLNIDADKAALLELAPDIVGYGVNALSLAPTLPPVLTDCNGKSLLKLQMGDALIGLDVEFLGLVIQAKVYTTIEADIKIVASGSELGLQVNGLTLLHFDAVEVNEAWQGKETELEGILKGVLESQLEGLLTDALQSIPLPAFDLSGILPGVPEGTTMQFGEAESFKQSGYISIEGTL